MAASRQIFSVKLWFRASGSFNSFETWEELFVVERPCPFLENVKIVIADDKPDFRLPAARFLALRARKPSRRKNAFEALRLVREIRPDVVLSDINMSGRSGIELLADIRSLGRESDGCVPVIAMTAHLLDEAVVDAGFQRVTRKPFTPDQLVATIDWFWQKIGVIDGQGK